MKTPADDIGRLQSGIQLEAWRREQLVLPEQVQRWFDPQPKSYASRLKKAGLEDSDLLRLQQSLPLGKSLTWKTQAAIVIAIKTADHV